MRNITDLYLFQQTAVNHIVSNYGSMLWLDVGLGKTIVSLTAIEYLQDTYNIRAALVVGTVSIVEAVWEQECQEWAHTRRLKCSLVRGSVKQRINALEEMADIYLINYEQLPWLQTILHKEFTKKGKKLPFDMVVFDEVSKMKTSTSKRVKAFAKILPECKYRVGLTGTPATNGYIDLHGQYFSVDGGRRLGPNITSYRDSYFLYNDYSRKYRLRRGCAEVIRQQIADITLEMNRDDYLELPKLITRDIKLDLPSKLKALYKEFEKEYFVEINSAEIEAFDAATKSTKCRQLANGFVYHNQNGEEKRTIKTFEHFHNVKLDALEELYRSLQYTGSPLLTCYQFIADRERLAQRFPDATIMTRDSDTANVVKMWNAGEIPHLIVHPASAGHGLNLQYGGHHIAWFGMPWSLEHYLQAIGRLDRNGQVREVVNHRFIMKDTIEETVAAVIGQKGVTQAHLRYAVQKLKESCYV